MPDEPEPTLPPSRDPRNPEYRKVLTVFTGLLIAGLVTAAIWPAGAPPRGEQVVAAPPPSAPEEPATKAPQPGPQPQPPGQTEPPHAAEPVTPPEPAKPPEPAPPVATQPPEPLPARPQGEPSLLVSHGDRSCQQIALTYDAGSGADGAAVILDVLKKHGLRSTFFLTGRWVEKFPDLAKRIAAEGHEIANHTYSHPDLTKLKPNQVLEEIRKGEEAIRRVTGRETRPLFREPYGAFNEAQRRLVRQAGYSYSIYWDNDTLDWQFPSVETLVTRITTKSQNGSIVLMHLNVPDSAIASDQAIPVLREKGYKLVTVTEVMSCR